MFPQLFFYMNAVQSTPSTGTHTSNEAWNSTSTLHPRYAEQRESGETQKVTLPVTCILPPEGKGFKSFS